MNSKVWEEQGGAFADVNIAWSGGILIIRCPIFGE